MSYKPTKMDLAKQRRICQQLEQETDGKLTVKSDPDTNEHTVLDKDGLPYFFTKGTHAILCAITILQACKSIKGDK